jgi:hypothetical protein
MAISLKLRPLKNFINARVFTGVSTGAILVLSLAWCAADPGFEPAIAAVAGFAAFASLFKYSFLSFDKNIIADRIALIVGNYDYRHSVLPNVKNDVEALCVSLKAKGFRIIKRENPSTENLKKAIYDFQAILSTGGVGLFYYAGHAGQFEGRDHILPVDVDDSSLDSFRANSLDVNTLLGPVDAIIDESPKHNGSAIIYSTASGTMAADAASPEAKHSPFATVLLELIEKWNLELFDLFRSLCVRVPKLTNGMQVPWIAASLDVEFYFKPIVREEIGVLKLLIFDACRTNPFAWSSTAALPPEIVTRGTA